MYNYLFRVALYVCMYVRMYIYMCVCMCAYICIDIYHTFTYICTHIYLLCLYIIAIKVYFSDNYLSKKKKKKKTRHTFLPVLPFPMSRISNGICNSYRNVKKQKEYYHQNFWLEWRWTWRQTWSDGSRDCSQVWLHPKGHQCPVRLGTRRHAVHEVLRGGSRLTRHHGEAERLQESSRYDEDVAPC